MICVCKAILEYGGVNEDDIASELHSTYAAARLAGVTPQTVRNDCRLGKVEFLKTTSGRFLISDAAVERYMGLRAADKAARAAEGVRRVEVRVRARSAVREIERARRP